MEPIDQQRLRTDSAELIRRLEAGESFVVTRNGRPVADLVSRAPTQNRRRLTLGEARDQMRTLPQPRARISAVRKGVPAVRR